MSVRLTILIGALLTLALAGAGCGGGDASDDPVSIEVSTSSLDKQQYLRRADKACGEERSKALEEFGAPVAGDRGSDSGEGGSPEGAELVATFLSAFEDEVSAVQALGAPPGDEQRVEAMLAAKQEATEAAGELGDVPAVQLEAVFRTANEMMRRYGLRTCLIGAAGAGTA